MVFNLVSLVFSDYDGNSCQGGDCCFCDLNLVLGLCMVFFFIFVFLYCDIDHNIGIFPKKPC